MAYPKSAAVARRRAVGAHAALPSREDAETADATGSHTDGVTVADLIAKLNGDQAVPPELRRHRPEPERRTRPLRRATDPDAAEPPAPPTEVIGARAGPSSHAVAADTRTPRHRHLPRRGGRGLRTAGSGVRRAGAIGCQPSRVGSARRTRQHTAHRGRRKTMVAGRAAAALIAVLALALTGGAWQWQSSKNNMLNKVSALDQDSRDIVDPNAQFGDENFLIVGVDSRFGENLDMGAGTTEDAGGSRSDTVMLVNIPANRKRVVAVSFPRDLAIEPMECEPWNPETGEYGPLYDEETESYGPDEVYTETKLNSAYSVGGPKCLVKVVQKLSGLSVNRFMAVDFAGFSKMVDALGGVEVCSTTPLEDYELGTVLPNAGRQMIDGHTALQYVRARQVTTETNGDYGRIKRQQLFLSSLLRSLISKEVFFSLSKLNNVVNMFIDDSYVDNINTKDLVDLGQSIQGVNAGPDHLRHRADRRIHRRVRQRAPARGRHAGDCSTRSSTTTRCPRRRTPTTPRCPARPSRRPARRRNRRARRRAGSAPSTELVNAVTTSPAGRHRAGVELDRRGRARRHRGQRTASARLQRHHTRRLPRPAGRDDGVLLAGQRTGRGDGGFVVRQPDHRTGHRPG